MKQMSGYESFRPDMIHSSRRDMPLLTAELPLCSTYGSPVVKLAKK